MRMLMIRDALKKSLVARLVYEVSKDSLDRYPHGFMAVQRFVRRNHPTYASLIGRDTDIVIDGFPRSGSSFVCRTFEAATTRRPTVAHHVHHSSHVIEACRTGRPALVLIRSPREAIISLKALTIQSAAQRAGANATATATATATANANANAAAPASLERRFPLCVFTRWYVHFYERLVPHLGAVVLTDFGQVKQDSGAIIRRVNERFGTDFEEFIHTPQTQQAIFESNGYHLSPSAEREKIKTSIAAEYDASSNRHWAARAEQIYTELTRHHAAAQNVSKDDFTTLKQNGATHPA